MGSKRNSNGGKPRRFHHFRPLLHLRHFANADKCIFVYDKERQLSPGQYPIRRLAAENNLYAPDRVKDGGSDPDAIEVWLAESVDGPAAAPLDKACRNQQLDRSERSRLAAFIAAQDLRTPKARDSIVGSLCAEMNAWYDGLATDLSGLRASILAHTGVDCPESLLSEYLASHEIHVPKAEWLNFMTRNLNRAAERLYNLDWRLLSAPVNREFFTTDIGIIKFGPSFAKILDYEMGFVGGRNRWLFPLTSRFALAIGASGPFRTIEVPTAWIDAVNRQMINDARRFVFSHMYDASITKAFPESD